MNTIAWIFILCGVLVLRAVSKGRVMDIGTDLSDAFLALINGNTDELTAVLGRTGDSIAVDKASAVTGMGDNPATASAYKLGAVKPVAAAAAAHFGPKHGIKDIGGVGAGSVPGSDHPNGLALDFMTKDKAVGDALAADLIANKDAWHVKYVIWWKRINTLDGRGWRPYSGPSDHTNHVHASFKNAPVLATRQPKV